jgi:hypothetical protein|uniref:Uncharacterized protein n=1 Tax=viral metagenome TaxID=1070528 RepID=A0A6C0HF09_9ZZZZ
MDKFPVFINNLWYSWTPVPGIDSTIGILSLQVAAVVYVQSILQGTSEDKAQQLAEKTAFTHHYRVTY